MSYGVLKKFIIIFLIVYFSAGMLARHLSKGPEDVYPFFSWFLFHRVPPRTQTGFSIRVHELDGRRFEPPIFFEEVGDMYDKDSRSAREYQHLVRILGRSVKQNKTDEVERLREKLERNFLSHPATYEIVEVTYNPVDRWRTGRLIDVKSIDIFMSE